jgi:hypothetical protein
VCSVSPLEAFIRDFTGDDDYYVAKEKMGSLARAPEGGDAG